MKRMNKKLENTIRLFLAIVTVITNFSFIPNVFASTYKDYEIVEHVKEVDSSFKTSFIMDYGFGDLSIFEAADGISLCSIFWTPDMINRVHESGKNTFTWTVNTKDNMCYMDGIGVDNYITDNILLCKEYINSK